MDCQNTYGSSCCQGWMPKEDCYGIRKDWFTEKEICKWSLFEALQEKGTFENGEWNRMFRANEANGKGQWKNYVMSQSHSRRIYRNVIESDKKEGYSFVSKRLKKETVKSFIRYVKMSLDETAATSIKIALGCTPCSFCAIKYGRDSSAVDCWKFSGILAYLYGTPERYVWSESLVRKKEKACYTLVC